MSRSFGEQVGKGMPPNNLPVAYTSFIGRESELAAIRAMLTSRRLLTLTGPGGCGKTRLALQTAWEVLESFPDGVWWCDLSRVPDPAYVPQEVASALKIATQPGRSIIDGVHESISDKKILVVLDNCEHVQSACAALATALLNRCPNLRILATSLQSLGLPVEKAWNVPPMAVPSHASVQDEEASPALSSLDGVQLFIQRAIEALPEFRLSAENAGSVARICSRLDGIPLAIELAAARINLLNAEQIDERLDGALQLLKRSSGSDIPRHQTLQATLDWTHQFLSAPEQALLRRLAIFNGSFNLEMVEAICWNEEEFPAALDLLSSLMEKSFLLILPHQAQTGRRYRLLEIIRQYAREKLEKSGEAQKLRFGFLEWCVELAEQAEPHLTGADLVRWFHRLEIELDNLRTALRWACTSQQVEPGLRLAAALYRLWMRGSLLTEGLNWLEELLHLEAGLRAGDPTQAIPAAVRAQAAYVCGRLAIRLWDEKRALQRGQESLELFSQLGDPAGKARALDLLALVSQTRYDFPAAIRLQEEAIAFWKTTSDTHNLAVSLINLGTFYQDQGDYRQAADYYAQAIPLVQSMTDSWASASGNLAEAFYKQGDYRRAEALCRECLTQIARSGNQYSQAEIYLILGRIAYLQGNLDRAEDLFQESTQLSQQIANPAKLGEALNGLANVAHQSGRLDQSRALYEQSLVALQNARHLRGIAALRLGLGRLEADQGRMDAAEELFHASLQLALDTHDPLAMVEALEQLAGLLAQRNEPAGWQQAVRWLALTQAQRSQMHAPLPPIDTPYYEQTIQTLRSRIEEPLFFSQQKAAASTNLEKQVGAILAEPAREFATQNLSIAPIETTQLRIHALGPVRVIVQDRNLARSDWVYIKSRELLFYLLHRPFVTKEQIGLDLWPDISTEQLRANFHRTLFYLRKALGRADWILYTQGTYAFNQDQGYWYDVAVFEDHIKQASRSGLLTTLPPDKRPQAINHLEAAVDLWRGDYLEDLNTEQWAIYPREALRQAYLAAMIDLGQLFFIEARYQQAAAIFQRILSVDDLLELAHRELMRCFARQNEVGQALRHYQQLRQLLNDELGSEPSRETQLLYERLRRGDDV
jgi:predicted ATPase/DNA-binding SARP family transcriptional activator/Tfp pilus assembly protein PilF